MGIVNRRIDIVYRWNYLERETRCIASLQFWNRFINARLKKSRFVVRALALNSEALKRLLRTFLPLIILPLS